MNINKTLQYSNDCRVIKRSELRNIVCNNLRKSGDPEKLRPTIECVLNTITQCRIDSSAMATHTNGDEVLLTLMGNHVYTWHNKEFIDAVKFCFNNASIVKESLVDNDTEYIKELSETDPRIKGL